MSGAKVVGIHGGTPGPQSASKPLPVPLVKLRELMKQHVHGLLRKLFDGADDALFAMADKAGTNNEQTIYFDAMRELRLQKKHIATAVVKGLIKSFNEVGQYRAKFIKEQDGGADLDELSLVQNEELEIRVAVEGMVSRLRTASKNNLEEMQVRVENLLGSRSIEADQLPSSPEVLCDSFIEGCIDLDIDIRAQLVVLKLFERFVLSEMVKAYEDSNALLVQLGVVPDTRKLIKAKQQSGRPSSSSKPSAAQSTHPPSNEGGFEGAHQGYQGSYSESETDANGTHFEDLCNLLHVAQGQQRQHGTQVEPPTLSSVFYSQNDLIGALSDFQTQSLQQDLSAGAGQLLDLRALLSRSLAHNDCEADYSETDSDVINLVSMLFEFILDDRQLQPTMKALIARLQIPILKVALMDRNFFNRGGHPARKLLNEIASAALGWNEPAEGKADRLKDKIEAVVETILKDFDNDLNFFASLLQEFSAFLDVEQRRGQLVEQRTKDSEKGRVASEMAKKAAQDNLNESLKGHSVPEEVIELLRDGWSSFMVLHYLKEGEQGEAWLDACALVDELVWSVNPRPADADSRARLLKMIPSLMKRLRAGLQEVSFDEFKTKSLLKSLEDFHVRALQQLQSAALETREVEQERVSDANTQEPEALSLDAREVEDQDEAVADLVRSTMELEIDFKSSKANAPEQKEGESSEFSEHADPVEEPVEVQTTSASEESSDSEEIVLVSLEAEAETPEIDESDPFVQQVEKFAVGCWFEFQDNANAERCKLAAVIKATGKYIFVNRAGIKVAEKSKMGLAVELRRGSVQILNDGLLFDRALESIITNLRGRSDAD